MDDRLDKRWTAAKWRARQTIRSGLIRAGTRVSSTSLADARVALGYLELGAQYGRPRAFASREALFAFAADMTGSSERPLYLEFGVYEGKSLRWWSQHLPQPDARLVGFDSFQGLPDDWRPGLPQGAFAASMPIIEDPRVSFEVGWFDETLPTVQTPEHDLLILNIDCDVYSSTRTVLEWAESFIRPGTLIYFDELPDHDHELRALSEHLAKTGAAVEPLGTSDGGLQWLFRYTACPSRPQPDAAYSTVTQE